MISLIEFMFLYWIICQLYEGKYTDSQEEEGKFVTASISSFEAFS